MIRVSGSLARFIVCHDTLLSESAHALTSTPTVSSTTLRTCRVLYCFPLMTPINIVDTLPKLRRMIWTGTLMLKAKAQLLSILMLKNMAAMNVHFQKGTFGVFRLYDPVAENCVG